MPRLRTIFIAVGAVLALCAFATSSAFASTKQITIAEEQNGLNSNPMATLETMKAMGVTEAKYYVDWSYTLSPSAQSASTAPTGSSSPQYYIGGFGQIEEIDQDAAKVGIGLQLLVTGPAPKWAETSTTGCSAYAIANSVCNPSPTAFAVFVEALGLEFSGKVAGVPAVTAWSIWNEPNYGVNLSPEMVGASTYSGADQYRNLLDAAYASLKLTGHAGNTILFGDLAPRGISGPSAGTNAGIKPVQFLASLYCVTTAGKRLTGTLASENGCPASASTFKSENPALFNASGVADHPYSQGIAPTVPTADCKIAGEPTACASGGGRKADPLWTDLAGINNLTGGLSKDLKAYGSSKQFPIYSTEYGYWTNPPGVAKDHCRVSYQADCDASVANAEIWLNEGEYISYKNPRIASFDQYQIYMPTSGELVDNAWSNGLLTSAGTPEPTFDAWEVPLWIPTTSLKRAGNLTLWGGVRPATYFQSTAKVKPQVAIQFKGRSGGWKTVKTQTVPTGSNNPGSYFTTSVKITASGSIRLVYTAGKSTLDSRTQAVTVK